MFLNDANIEIGIRKVLFINLWDRFDEENRYFYEDIRLIKSECIKLPNFKYLVAIPVKNTDNYIYILFTDKYNNDSRKNDIDMLNTLSYLHLLPSKEFKKKHEKILKQLNSKSFLNGDNKAKYNLTKKVLAILNKRLSE